MVRTRTASFDWQDVKLHCENRWQDIHTEIGGCNPSILDGQGHPCPCCGGTDRFHAKRAPRGSYQKSGIVSCRREDCDLHKQDGIQFLQWLTKKSFSECVNRLGDYLNLQPGQARRDGNGHSPKKPARAKTASPPDGKRKRKPDTYGNVKARAQQSVARGMGKGVSISGIIEDRYTDASGEVMGVQLRFDLSDGGKEIRPVRKVSDGGEDGWLLGAIPAPRPLFHLKEAVGSGTVYVVEGEKAAKAMQGLEFVATTSLQGAQSPRETDWSPLDGKVVMLMPDNDEPGRNYVRKVAGLLADQAPEADVFIANLNECWPECPPKGDAHDWWEANDEKPPAWFHEQLAEVTKPYEVALETQQEDVAVTGDGSPAVPRLEPEAFPVDTLPHAMRNLTEAVCGSLGVSPASVVLPAFSVLSACIGNSRRVVSNGHAQPLMIWSAVVGESGTQKSAPFAFAVDPLGEMNEEVIRESGTAAAEYEKEMEVYKVDFGEWKKKQKGGVTPEGRKTMPVKPVAPPKGRLKLVDYTYEALVDGHAGSPRGIIIASEELSAFFGGMDRYSSSVGVGGDSARMLTAYDGGDLTSDRISNFRYVPSAHIAVCGTTQPGILIRCFSSEHRQSGLASRFWIAKPPGEPMRYRENAVSDGITGGWRELCLNLWRMQPEGFNDAKWMSPHDLVLSSTAEEVFRGYFDRTGELKFSVGNDSAAAIGKWIGRCARIAGILHCCETHSHDIVANPIAGSFEIGPETMERAVRISLWGQQETLRLYDLLGEDEGLQDLRVLADWLRQKGGEITARDLCIGRRDIPNAEAAEAELMKMAKAGWGQWKSIHRSRKFILNPPQRGE